MPAYVELSPDGTCFGIRTPFKREFVDELKMRCSRRAWDPTSKVWLVERSEWSKVESLIKEHFGEIKYGPAAQAALVEEMVDEAEPELEDFVILGVRSDAPVCVIHGAFAGIVAEYQRMHEEAHEKRVYVPRSDTPDIREAFRAYNRVCHMRDLKTAFTKEEVERRTGRDLDARPGLEVLAKVSK